MSRFFLRILRRYSVIAENASDISARTAPTAAGTLSNVSPGRSTLLKCDCISFGPLTFKTNDHSGLRYHNARNHCFQSARSAPRHSADGSETPSADTLLWTSSRYCKLLLFWNFSGYFSSVSPEIQALQTNICASSALSATHYAEYTKSFHLS